MSKSKPAPSVQESPAKTRLKLAAGIRKIFLALDRRLRAPWLLALGYAVYILWAWGVSYGLSAAFSTLFETWGLTSANLHLAPAWARFVANYYGSAISLVSSAGAAAIALLLTCVFLREKTEISFRPRDLALGSGLGALVVAVSAGFFLLTDSMRIAAPPSFSAEIVTFLPVCFAAACAEEAFCRAFVLKSIVRTDSPKRRTVIIACAVSALMLMLTTGAFSLGVLGALNMLLLGLICAALHLGGHAWLSAGFRFAWSYVSVAIFSFPGGTAASAPMLSLYHVSDVWLTGGASGLICGAWMTILLAVALALLFFIGKKRQLS